MNTLQDTVEPAPETIRYLNNKLIE